MHKKTISLPDTTVKADTEKVKKLHASVIKHAENALERALEIGEILARIKAQIPHGKWLPWVDANLPEISCRTVQNYLRIWQNRGRLKNANGAFFVQSYTEALAAAYDRHDETGVDRGVGEAPAKDSTERSRKRDVLRRLGREFVKGLEVEDSALLELLLQRLPQWRHSLIEAARREVNGEAAKPVTPEPPHQLAA